jgi:hypothetical protein
MSSATPRYCVLCNALIEREKNGMFKAVNCWDLNFSERKILDFGKNAVVA